MFCSAKSVEKLCNSNGRCGADGEDGRRLFSSQFVRKLTLELKYKNPKSRWLSYRLGFLLSNWLLSFERTRKPLFA